MAQAEKPKKSLLARGVPFGLGQVKPKHFRSMFQILWENRGNLPYAYQVITRGVKALAAGIPLVAAIGAHSSLAVSMAQKNGQTLVGFLRDKGMNLYANPKTDRELNRV